MDQKQDSLLPQSNLIFSFCEKPVFYPASVPMIYLIFDKFPMEHTGSVQNTYFSFFFGTTGFNSNRIRQYITLRYLYRNQFCVPVHILNCMYVYISTTLTHSAPTYFLTCEYQYRSPYLVINKRCHFTYGIVPVVLSVIIS